MSFGFSVGDFVTVSGLILSLYRSFKDAPSEFQEISRQLESFHIVLVDLKEQSEEPTSLLNRNGASRRQELFDLRDSLMTTMQELENLYKRYKRMGRISWARLEFGQRDLSALRGKLTVHLTALNTFIGSLTVSALGRMEPMLVEIYRLLDNRVKENPGMAQTVLSARDEVAGNWDRITMELRTEGIPAAYLEKNEEQIRKVVSSVVEANSLEGCDSGYEDGSGDGINPDDSISQLGSSIRIGSASRSTPKDATGLQSEHYPWGSFTTWRATIFSRRSDDMGDWAAWGTSRKSRNTKKRTDIADSQSKGPGWGSFATARSTKKRTNNAGQSEDFGWGSPAKSRNTNKKKACSPYSKNYSDEISFNNDVEKELPPSSWLCGLTLEERSTQNLLLKHGFNIGRLSVPGTHHGSTSSIASFLKPSLEQRAWEWAVENNNMEAAKLIVKRFGSRNCPLLQAAYKGRWGFVALCLEAATQPFTVELGVCHGAARSNRCDILQELSRVGTSLGDQPQLSIKGWYEHDRRKALVAAVSGGWAPRHFSAWFGSFDAAKLLLEHDANPDQCTKNNSTLLHLAACGPSSDAVAAELTQLFIDAGLDPTVENDSHHTPLYYSVYRGYERTTGVLLKAGAVGESDVSDRKSRKTNSWSTLHIAARLGHLHIIKFLLDGGLDIDRISDYPVYGGSKMQPVTPIMWACQSKSWEVAVYLRERGASLKGLSQYQLKRMDTVPATLSASMVFVRCRIEGGNNRSDWY